MVNAMTMTNRRAACWRRALFVPLLLGGCATAYPPDICLLPRQHHATALTLYFGRDIKGGGSVTDAAWQAFAADTLTPAFPDGFTIVDGTGQWRSPEDGRISRERSTIVQVVGDVAAAKVESVSAAYRQRFRQEAVGVVTNPVCAAF